MTPTKHYRCFKLEGEPAIVKAIMFELRLIYYIIFEGEYDAGEGLLGKNVVYYEY